MKHHQSMSFKKCPNRAKKGDSVIEHSWGGVVLLCGEAESPEKHGEDTVVRSVPFPAPLESMVFVF